MHTQLLFLKNIYFDQIKVSFYHIISNRFVVYWERKGGWAMYEDIIQDGDKARKAYKEGIDAFLLRLEKESYAKREAFMPAEGFPEKIEIYRQKYIEMLGIDRIPSEETHAPSLTYVGEDADAKIYRVSVFITREIPMQGLLFVPHGIEKVPLIIAQHGGGGTPELCSDMNGKNNYNRMVRRLLGKGVAVFAPQLLLWNQGERLETQPSHPIPYKRIPADQNLKRFGMSITALEIRGIMNSITYLSSLPFIEREKIAMMGISYGGYFTLHTMAADPRIKAGFSNACFNDRNTYPWFDWSYPNSANTFHDAEVAALCAPRRLYIAVGREDAVFTYKTAIPEAERVKKYFEAFGSPENYVFLLWEGGHTLPSEDDGIDFILSALK